MKVLFQHFSNIKSSVVYFRIGIFLILSAPVIAYFFFIISISIITLTKRDWFFKNKFNYPLVLCSLILVTSAFLNTTIFKPDLIGWQPYLGWVGLANWIPLFYFYWAFQELLPNSKSIEKTIKIYCIGSIPLFISGFSQVWLNWHGPFRFLNNLIIWYQRPVDFSHPLNGMTSLFSNQNYAGAWLIIIWPMFLACLLQQKLFGYKRFILILLTISSLLAIYFSRSRNAWIGTLISTNFVIDKTFSIWFIVFFALSAILLIFLNQFSPNVIEIISQNILPPIFLNKFSNIGLENLLSYPRILLWQNSLEFISQRPFLGWGTGAFPLLFRNKNNYEPYAHPHNLILELGNSYGILASLIVTIFVIVILFRSFKKIYFKRDKNESLIFEKAWWASTFTLSLSQLVDIQYFDFRISITFWILLAGLTSKIRRNNQI